MTDESPGEGETSLPVNRLLAVASALFALVFTLVVASLVTELVLSVTVGLGIVAEETNTYQLVQTIASFVGFLPGVIGYMLITDQRDLIPLSQPTLRHGGLVLGVAVGLYGLQIGLLFSLQELGLRTAQNPATMAAGDPVVYYAAMIAVSILIVGPAEELLFRGIIQGGLRRSFGPIPAILLASVLFGVLHAGVQGSPSEQVAYMGITVLLGAILGVLYERTENVLVPGLAHGVYNGIIFAGLLWGAL